MLVEASRTSRISKLEQGRRDDALQAMLDEFRVNPVIDKEIRGNQVIMTELAKAVSRTIHPRRELPKNFSIKE